MNYLFKRNKPKSESIPIQESNSINQIGLINTLLSSNGNLLSNASVIRAISSISSAISSMKINEYRIINGEKTEVDTQLEYLLNTSSNAYMSGSLFKKLLVENVFKYGNSLVKIERTLNNDIVSVM